MSKNNIQKTAPLFISRRELSSRLGVSEATTRRLEKSGTIRGIQVGVQSRYRWEDVLASLQHHTAGKNSKNNY